MQEQKKKEFQNLDYICCSSYGRLRSKSFHWKHYKKLLLDNDVLPEQKADDKFKEELLDIVADTSEYLVEAS